MSDEELSDNDFYARDSDDSDEYDDDDDVYEMDNPQMNSRIWQAVHVEDEPGGFEATEEEVAEMEELDEFHGIAEFLSPEDMDAASYEYFFMNCYCVVAAMPNAIIESIQMALAEFIGGNVPHKVAQFGYASLENFLDTEIARGIFSKEMDALDRPTYRVKPFEAYKDFQDLIEERLAWEDMQKTPEEKAKREEMAKSTKERAVMVQQNRYDFLKLLRDCGGESNEVQLVRLQEAYEEKTLKRFDKHYWRNHFGSSSASKALSRYFSCDVSSSANESPMYLIFKRPFKECKREIVSELRRHGVDTSEIEAESEEADIPKRRMDQDFMDFFSTKPPKKSSEAANGTAASASAGTSRHAIHRGLESYMGDQNMRAMIRSMKDASTDQKQAFVESVQKKKTRDEELLAQLRAPKKEVPSSSRKVEEKEAEKKTEEEPAVPPNEEKPKPARVAKVRRPLRSESSSSDSDGYLSDSESDDSRPLVVASAPRNTNYQRIQEFQALSNAAPPTELSAAPIPEVSSAWKATGLSLEKLVNLNLMKVVKESN